MELNGVTLELDIYDVESAERYNNAIDAFQKASEQETVDMVLADKIRLVCTAVYHFFDALFGEGTAQQVFAGKMNMNTCLDYAETVINEVGQQTQAMANRLNAMTPNRAARRSKKAVVN